MTVLTLQYSRKYILFNNIGDSRTYQKVVSRKLNNSEKIRTFFYFPANTFPYYYRIFP